MKKIRIGVLILTCIICLIPIGVGLIFYNDIPEIVAIHFDINNNPNGYMSKNVFVFALPIIMSFVQVAVCLIADLKIQDKNLRVIYKLIAPIITVIMYTIIVLYALQYILDVRKCAMLIVGVIFIIMGYFIPKTDSDKYVNLPKIKDEKLRAKINKIYGTLFIIDGILLIISTMFSAVVSLIALVLVLIQAIILYIYSLIKNRQFAKGE